MYQELNTPAVGRDEHQGVDPDEWNRLVESIRRGDAAAEAEFVTAYGRGIGVLCRRQLGAVNARALVEEAVVGALREIRRGVLSEPRDLVHFLRNVVQRERLARDMEPEAGPESNTVPAGDQPRIRDQAQRIERALQRFSASEQTALREYYLDGATAEQVCGARGWNLAEFRALRAQLQQAAAAGTTGGRGETRAVRTLAASRGSAA